MTDDLAQIIAEMRALSERLERLVIRRRDGTARQPPKAIKEAAEAIRALLVVVEAAQMYIAEHDRGPAVVSVARADLRAALSNLARNL